MLPIMLAACLSLATPSPARVVPSASPARVVSSRRELLHRAAAAAAAGGAPARAFAADKGKEYNDCMSKCMYEVPV